MPCTNYGEVGNRVCLRSRVPLLLVHSVQDLLSAVYRRWKHLALTALLLMVLVYVYAVLAFVFFRQLAVVEVDRGYVRDCVDPPSHSCFSLCPLRPRGPLRDCHCCVASSLID
jgi:hypothetical protein